MIIGHPKVKKNNFILEILYQYHKYNFIFPI
jgi:hypothetical protein